MVYVLLCRIRTSARIERTTERWLAARLPSRLFSCLAAWLSGCLVTWLPGFLTHLPLPSGYLLPSAPVLLVRRMLGPAALLVFWAWVLFVLPGGCFWAFFVGADCLCSGRVWALALFCPSMHLVFTVLAAPCGCSFFFVLRRRF